jgi:hypothetical protein
VTRVVAGTQVEAFSLNLAPCICLICLACRACLHLTCCLFPAVVIAVCLPAELLLGWLPCCPCLHSSCCYFLAVLLVLWLSAALAFVFCVVISLPF